MYSNSDKETRYKQAYQKVQKIKSFYANLISYLLFIPFLIYINLTFSPNFHWFWFPAFGWGVGVVFHGIDAYGYNLFLGKDWEEKKIKELMDREEKFKQ